MLGSSPWMILRAKHLMAHHWSININRIYGPIPISVKWHSISPLLRSLCPWLLLTFTYLLASVVDFAPSAPPFNKQFSGCSLLNETFGTAALIALCQWEISYRGRAPIRVLKNPFRVSSTAHCLLPYYGFLKSLFLSLYRKSIPYHTYLLALIECYPFLLPLQEGIS